MLTSISASNGGGFVPQEEFAEALGAWMLARYAEILSDDGFQWQSGNTESLDTRYYWDYKGHRYRILWFPANTQMMTGDRLHFDYLSEV